MLKVFSFLQKLIEIYFQYYFQCYWLLLFVVYLFLFLTNLIGTDLKVNSILVFYFLKYDQFHRKRLFIVD